MKRLSLLLFLLCAPAHAEEAPVLLAEEAVQSSPSLAALSAREQALRSRSEVAGAWPDPVLALEYSNAPLTAPGLSSHPMSGLQLKATQTLRPRGWSPLQESVGAQRADVAEAATREAALQLRVSVHQTWWMLTRSRLLQDVTRQHLARTEELLLAARSRYETGSLGLHAVLRLEVLRDQLTDELQDFTRSDQELTAALGRALGRQTPGSFPTPSAIVPLPPPAEADWTSLAREHRPLLESITRQKDTALQSAQLARVDAFPDVSVWAGYRLRTIQTETDPGTDLFSLGVAVPIPVGSARRADGAEAEALALAQAAEHTHTDALNRISADMTATLARWQRAFSKAGIYQSQLLPGAQAVLDTSLADFSVGRADFASLFEAEVALLNLDRAWIIAATDTWLQDAAATAVLGTSPTGERP